MSALILLRHSLTEANERRLYCGWTDLPLSPAGQALCRDIRAERPLPPCEHCVVSGLRRTEETLRLLTDHAPTLALPELREMRFGRFEMHSYEELKDDPEYQRWIGDDYNGAFPCPGGESRSQFKQRVLKGGQALLDLSGDVLAVCHGGVIANLMAVWFPELSRNFYEWQPAPCRGYRLDIQYGAPMRFIEI